MKLWLPSIQESIQLPDSCVVFISRHTAEQLIPEPGAAIISIIDFKGNEANLQGGWQYIHTYDFIDGEYTFDMLRDYPASTLDSMLCKDQAFDLKNNISLIISKRVQKIFVHCYAGRARSCAVAMYISEEFNLPIYSGEQTHPQPLSKSSPEMTRMNSMVYELLKDPELYTRRLPASSIDDDGVDGSKTTTLPISYILFGILILIGLWFYK